MQTSLDMSNPSLGFNFKTKRVVQEFLYDSDGAIVAAPSRATLNVDGVFEGPITYTNFMITIAGLNRPDGYYVYIVNIDDTARGVPAQCWMYDIKVNNGIQAKVRETKLDELQTFFNRANGKMYVSKKIEIEEMGGAAGIQIWNAGAEYDVGDVAADDYGIFVRKNTAVAESILQENPVPNKDSDWYVIAANKFDALADVTLDSDKKADGVFVAYDSDEGDWRIKTNDRMGVWVHGWAYNKNDIVLHEGKLYKARTLIGKNNSKAPSNITSDWYYIEAKSETNHTVAADTTVGTSTIAFANVNAYFQYCNDWELFLNGVKVTTGWSVDQSTRATSAVSVVFNGHLDAGWVLTLKASYNVNKA